MSFSTGAVAAACPTDAALMAFADGSSDDAGRINAHIANCPECRAVLAEVARGDGEREPSGSEVLLRRGSTLGRYRIEECIGSGGMGVVYSATDVELGRKVAIKLLRVDRSKVAGTNGQNRLMREARALARLSHPNVVTVFDSGLHLGRHFIAIELVDGGNLTAWLNRGAHTRKQIIERLIEAGRGLGAAHAAGVVHRDVKPDNILVGSDERARVTDFGLAVEDVPLGPAETRVLAGTPAYMAPECLLGFPSTPKTDQWSFAATLYEALAGVQPFAAADPAGRAAAIAAGLLTPPLPGRSVPGWVRRIVLRGLSADPAARWPSMELLVDALVRGHQRTPRLAIAGLVLLALLALTALPGRSPPAPERPRKQAAPQPPPLDVAQSTRWSAWAVLGGNMRAITTAVTQDGRLELFAQDEGKSLWHLAQSKADGPWSEWEKLGSVAGGVTDIAVVAGDDSRIELFALGVEKTLHATRRSGPDGAWSPWARLGENLRGVAATANRDGRVELFAIADLGFGPLVHRAQTAPGGGWGDWVSLGGGMSKLAPAMNEDGRLDVFAIGADDGLHHLQQLTPGSEGWSGWLSLGGGLSKLATVPCWDGRLNVFVVGLDGGLHQIAQHISGGHWSGWVSLGGKVSELAVARNLDGRLEVFAIGPDQRLVHKYETAPSRGWSDWATLGTGLIKVATATRLDGRIDVVAIRADGAVATIAQTR